MHQNKIFHGPKICETDGAVQSISAINYVTLRQKLFILDSKVQSFKHRKKPVETASITRASKNGATRFDQIKRPGDIHSRVNFSHIILFCKCHVNRCHRRQNIESCAINPSKSTASFRWVQP